MKTVTKRELNQQTAHVLASVTPQEPLLITERGVARWRLEAVDGSVDPIERLIAEGRIIPAKGNPTPWREDQPLYTVEQVDAIYAASRDDH